MMMGYFMFITELIIKNYFLNRMRTGHTSYNSIVSIYVLFWIPFAGICFLTIFTFLRVKTTEAIKNYLQSLPSQTLKPVEKKFLGGSATTELLLELEWKRLFTSYAMAFNKQHQSKETCFKSHSKDWR